MYHKRLSEGLWRESESSVGNAPRKVWAVIALGALGLGAALFIASSRVDAQRAGGSSPATESPIFSPAHSNVLDAVREFFSLHDTPVQPIAYTHKAHLANGMVCTDCHTSVETGPMASIPGVEFCMVCHQMMAAEKPEIKKLAAYQERGEDVPWQRVYDYPPSAHVKFHHAAHIRAGVDCAHCHGDMTQQTVAVRVVDMTMGFCVDCHREKQASIDCITCHF